MSIQGMPSLSCLCTQSLDFNEMNIRSIVFFACALLCAVANAQTQADLNDDACEAYQEADKKLNAIYQQPLEQHKDDANFTPGYARRSVLGWRFGMPNWRRFIPLPTSRWNTVPFTRRAIVWSRLH